MRSRPTVYAGVRRPILRTHFEAPLLGGAAVTVRVDDAHSPRGGGAAGACAQCDSPHPCCRCSTGVKVSYGTIQQMLVDAECRAARFNGHGVQAGALDEMFSQGEMVLRTRDACSR